MINSARQYCKALTRKTELIEDIIHMLDKNIIASLIFCQILNGQDLISQIVPGFFAATYKEFAEIAFTSVTTVKRTLKYLREKELILEEKFSRENLKLYRVNDEAFDKLFHEYWTTKRPQIEEHRSKYSSIVDVVRDRYPHLIPFIQKKYGVQAHENVELDESNKKQYKTTKKRHEARKTGTSVRRVKMTRPSGQNDPSLLIKKNKKEKEEEFFFLQKEKNMSPKEIPVSQKPYRPLDADYEMPEDVKKRALEEMGYDEHTLSWKFKMWKENTIASNTQRSDFKNWLIRYLDQCPMEKRRFNRTNLVGKPDFLEQGKYNKRFSGYEEIADKALRRLAWINSLPNTKEKQLHEFLYKHFRGTVEDPFRSKIGKYVGCMGLDKLRLDHIDGDCWHFKAPRNIEKQLLDHNYKDDLELALRAISGQNSTYRVIVDENMPKWNEFKTPENEQDGKFKKLENKPQKVNKSRK